MEALLCLKAVLADGLTSSGDAGWVAEHKGKSPLSQHRLAISPFSNCKQHL